MHPGQELAHPVPTMALLQTSLASTMCMHPADDPTLSADAELMHKWAETIFSAQWQYDVTKSAL